MVAPGRWFIHSFFIGSEIFELLRSSKYTPSVSHSLDSSLREGAGMGAHHSTGYSLNRGVTGDFHRPYETLNIWGRKKSKIFLDKWEISGYNKEADFGGAEII